MFPIESHRRQSVVVKILVSLAFALMFVIPGRAFSQPVFDRPATDTQRRVVEQIRDIETRDGPNSVELIEPLATLGLLYHDSGNDMLAAVANQRALEIARIVHGLYSLEQAQLVRQLISNHEALGQASAAWSLEQDLLELAERHPDDMRTVPIFRETADRRIETREQYLAGELPPQIVLGCYYGWPRTALRKWDQLPEGMQRCNAGSRRDVVQTLTVDAQKYYAKAIAVIHRRELYSSDVLRELEMELIRCSDFLRDYDNAHSLQLSIMSDIDDFGLSLEPWRSWNEAIDLLAEWNRLAGIGSGAREGRWRPEQYAIARESLQRLFAYAVMTARPWQQQADALIRIADWDLLYSRNASALREYERLYERLVQMDLDQAAIDRFFRPEIPVVLPGFRPSPLTPSGSSQTDDYIDVAFEITKFGDSRRVEVLAATTNISESEVDDLVRQIKRSQFRPRIAQSGSADRSRAEVRYYANR